MYGEVDYVVYEEELLFDPQQLRGRQGGGLRRQTRDAARRYIARPARRAYRTAAEHPMASIGGMLGLVGLAAVGYLIWQQYQSRGSYQHLGPVWDTPPRDPRGITMPTQREIDEYERQMETEPSAASQIY